MSQQVFSKKEEYNVQSSFSVLAMTGEACHLCITGSWLFAHSYANKIN